MFGRRHSAPLVPDCEGLPGMVWHAPPAAGLPPSQMQTSIIAPPRSRPPVARFQSQSSLMPRHSSQLLSQHHEIQGNPLYGLLGSPQIVQQSPFTRLLAPAQSPPPPPPLCSLSIPRISEPSGLINRATMMPAAEVEAAAAALNTFMMGDEDDGGPRRQRRHSSASMLSTGGLPPLMQAMQVTIGNMGGGAESLKTWNCIKVIFSCSPSRTVPFCY